MNIKFKQIWIQALCLCLTAALLIPQGAAMGAQDDEEIVFGPEMVEEVATGLDEVPAVPVMEEAPEKVEKPEVPESAMDECQSELFITVPTEEWFTVPGIQGGQIRFNRADRAITDCETTVTVANIPSSINNLGLFAIGDYAFSGCTGLTSITIPEGVTSIGDYAFSDCTSLTSITFPSTLTSIGSYAFDGCSKLTSITIPEGVTSISVYAFRNCTGLTSVTIPEGVTSIGSFAFYGCTSLNCIVIPKSVISIGSYAFWVYGYSNLKEVYYSGDATDKTNMSISSNNTRLTSAHWNYSINYADICQVTLLASEHGAASIPANIYLTGAAVPISVAPEDGYALKHILVDGQPLEGTTFVVSGDHTVSVEFEKPEGLLHSGTCGDDLLWYLYEDETLRIVGFGAMKNYSDTPPWYSYRAQIETVSLDEGMTSIGSYAFRSCTGLTSITIPEGITFIGYDAFYGCTGLASITFPSTLTSIGSNAFDGCTGLTSVTIPEGVTSIGNYAFRNCTSLTSITFPSTLTSIGSYAFDGCSKLTSITIPEGMTSIGDDAFYGCTGLTDVYISDIAAWCEIDFDDVRSNPLYYANNLCLNGEAVTDLVISEGVTSIGSCAFYGYSSLTSVTIPGSVTSIGGYAFYGCTGLTSITIPEGVTSIGGYAFRGCTGLTSITFPSTLTSIGSSAFDGCSKLTSITIPEGVTAIGSCAFSSCKGRFEFMGDAPSGGASMFASTMDKDAFSIYYHRGTTGWTSPTWCGYYATCVEETLTNFSTLDGANRNSQGILFTLNDTAKTAVVDSGYHGNNNGKVVIPATVTKDGTTYDVTAIGNFAFKNCFTLTSITILDGVTSIGSYAFQDCRRLTNIAIPGSVNIIGSAVFNCCTGLTSIVIPEGVTYIGSSAFNSCTGLTSITIPEGVNSIEDDTFRYCTSLTGITFPSTLTSIGDSAFSECSSLTSITIPGSVTSIGDSAFQYCRSLTNVTIPDGVNSIDWDVFKYCTGLTSVTIPDSVTSIGVRAFYGCTSLTSVTIPDSVTYIDSRAFEDCTGLTSVTIPDSVTSIGNYAFDGCTGLTDVYISDIAAWCEIKFSGSNPLYYANNLCLNGEAVTDLVIPEGVTSIGSCAFRGCTGLTSVTIPGSVTSIGYMAFNNCTGLTRINYDGTASQIRYGKDNLPLDKIYYMYAEVQFNENGGGGWMPEETVSNDAPYSLPECKFSAPNSEVGFFAWNVNGQNYVPGEDVMISGDTIVTAVWKNICTISFSSNGGGGGKMNDGTALETSVYVLPECTFANPPIQRFKAWDIDGQVYLPGAEVVVNADITALAIWEDCTHDGSHTIIEERVLKPWNCVNDGVKETTYMCDICGYISVVEEEAPATGEHVYGATIIVTAPIGNEEGLGKKICEGCALERFFPLFEVRYRSPDCAPSMPDEIFEGGSVLALPNCRLTPPDGRAFLCWEIDGTRYEPGDPYTVTANAVITPVWFATPFYFPFTAGYAPSTVTAYTVQPLHGKIDSKYIPTHYTLLDENGNVLFDTHFSSWLATSSLDDYLPIDPGTYTIQYELSAYTETTVASQVIKQPTGVSTAYSRTFVLRLPRTPVSCELMPDGSFHFELAAGRFSGKGFLQVATYTAQGQLLDSFIAVIPDMTAGYSDTITPQTVPNGIYKVFLLDGEEYTPLLDAQSGHTAR